MYMPLCAGHALTSRRFSESEVYFGLCSAAQMRLWHQCASAIVSDVGCTVTTTWLVVGHAAHIADNG